MIEFKCPKCGQQLEADYQAAGSKAKCFKCEAVVEVPWPEFGPRLQCPACKAECDFPPASAGMIEACPKCGCMIQVPGKGGSANAASGCAGLLGQGLVCLVMLVGLTWFALS